MFKKLSTKKGFTLMEMMIVVAIIAILMAIIIPTFNGAMNKAKAATDEANLRAYYAERMAEYILDGNAPTPVKDGTSVQVGGVTYNLYGKYTSTWDSKNNQLSISYTGPGTGNDATIPGVGNTSTGG